MSKDSVTYSMIVSQLLLERLRDIGLTQKDFFQKSGVSQATWSRISRGLAKISIEDLRSACSAVGIPISELIEDAEKVSTELPEMDVMVVDDLKELDGKTIATIIIAGAALAFLISRILRK